MEILIAYCANSKRFYAFSGKDKLWLINVVELCQCEI